MDDDDAMTTLTSLTEYRGGEKARGQQLYLLIDEYDRFANHFLLEREEFDAFGYRAAVVDAASPIKQIFTTLKSLQAKGLFVTGLLRLAFSDNTGSNTEHHYTHKRRGSRGMVRVEGGIDTSNDQ